MAHLHMQRQNSRPRVVEALQTSLKVSSYKPSFG